jgi:hypothetical protein
VEEKGPSSVVVCVACGDVCPQCMWGCACLCVLMFSGLHVCGYVSICAYGAKTGNSGQ